MTRPRKTPDEKRSRVVSFRLTSPEYARLEELARRAGLQANELARRLARSERRVTVQTVSRTDPALIAHLQRLGANLNQLVKNSHIFGRVSPTVDQVCEEIRQLVFKAIGEGAHE